MSERCFPRNCTCRRNISGSRRYITQARRLRQGLEVAPTVPLDQGAQAPGRDDLDGVAPLVEVPGHLEPAGGPKPHQKRPVGLRFDRLVRVKDELPRRRRRGRGESPDHLAMARLVLIGAERPAGMGGDIEAGLADEARPEQPRGADAVDAEMPERRVAVFIAGDEIAAHPEQDAVWRDAPVGRCTVGAGVGDGEQKRALERLGDRLEDAGFGAHHRSRAGGEALGLEQRLGIGLGTAGVGAGHDREQPVAQRRKRGNVGRGTLALGAADRHLERGELVVADALEAGEAGVAQLPATPAVLVDADFDAREGVLERPGHALRGAVVGVEGLGDLREGDARMPRRRHLRQPHQIPRLRVRHRLTLPSGNSPHCPG